MGSTWGKFLKISIFGESHGMGVGLVVDGFPSGLQLDMEHILSEMGKRAPGKHKLTTNRKEQDYPNILSGVKNGITTGAPICMMINNSDMHSLDYENLKDIPRPGHSDYSGQIRYKGENDLRGGGHFSGRLTAPLVFAGALCKQHLRNYHGIEIGSHIFQIGHIKDESFNLTEMDNQLLKELQAKAQPVINPQALDNMLEAVDAARLEGDSLGGIIECGITGVKPGIGSPIFENVESRIASLIYSIPGVKGLEFGQGFALSAMKGSRANDSFIKLADEIKTRTNNNGGILGGITTGMPISFKVGFKPTPSISKEQETLNIETGESEKLVIKGRHDPCITLRAPVVVETAVAIAILDLYLEAYGYDAR